jgi:hypothetical protein
MSMETQKSFPAPTLMFTESFRRGGSHPRSVLQGAGEQKDGHDERDRDRYEGDACSNDATDYCAERLQTCGGVTGV